MASPVHEILRCFFSSTLSNGNDTKKFVDLLETFYLSQHVSAQPIYQVIP